MIFHQYEFFDAPLIGVRSNIFYDNLNIDVNIRGQAPELQGGGEILKISKGGNIFWKNFGGG